MPIRLTSGEKQTAKRLAEIKHISGSHSPSPAMLAKAGVTIRYDFCYLSNPHATDLFLKYFRKDFRDANKLHSLVEHYPSQNKALAEKLVGIAGVSGKNIFVGNGATEIIQAVLSNFTKKKIVVPVPTFSPYLEFARKDIRIVRHQFAQENQFRLNQDRLLEDIRKEKPDTAVLINPNNPDGGYIEAEELQRLLYTLRKVETVIVDESFTHFASRKIESVSHLVREYPNLIIIKSLSKDFGIAGLRLGYAVMSEKRVLALLEKGYLWNVSGFGEYFLSLLGRTDFLKEYEKARLRAIGERDAFYSELSKMKELRVYPSKGNFFLVELLDGTTAHDLMVCLLVRYGVYVRVCKDKVGLEGEFIRVASRRKEENERLTQVLTKLFS